MSPGGWSHTQLGPELPIRPWAFDNRQPESPHCVAAEKSGLLPGARALSSLRRWPGSRARSRGKVDEQCLAPRLGLYPTQGSLPPGQLNACVTAPSSLLKETALREAGLGDAEHLDFFPGGGLREGGKMGVRAQRHRSTLLSLWVCFSNGTRTARRTAGTFPVATEKPPRVH